MKYTIYHNEVYYWLECEEDEVYRFLKILNQLCPSRNSDWFYGHAQLMSTWPVVNLSKPNQ